MLTTDNYDYLIKILLVGGPGVGKSTFCTKLHCNEFINNYSSTIGVDFFSFITPIDSKLYKLQIWDTAGQERFKSITRSYYRNSKIVWVMFDLNDFDSLSILKKVLFEIESYCDKDVKIILIGNKSDLKKNVEPIELNRIIQENNLDYIEISVKNNQDNFKQFFEKLGSILNEIPKTINNNRFVELDLDDNTQMQKKCCNIL